MLPGEPRNSTSQERVGCGLPRDPPSTIACPALPRAGDDRVFHLPREPLAQGSKKKPVRAVFGQKGLLWGLLGLESGEIEKDNVSITYALPFLRSDGRKSHDRAGSFTGSQALRVHGDRARPVSWLSSGKGRYLYPAGAPGCRCDDVGLAPTLVLLVTCFDWSIVLLACFVWLWMQPWVLRVLIE